MALLTSSSWHKAILKVCLLSSCANWAVINFIDTSAGTSDTLSVDLSFVTTTRYDSFCRQTKKVIYYYQAQELGYLYYDQFPLGIFVIYNLFINPLYRHRGHGTALLKFACQNLMQEGAQRIFIQPGPFELDPQQAQTLLNLSLSTQAERLQQLVRLYQRVGFVPATRSLINSAKLLYKLINIDADPNYLMVYKQ